MVSVSVCCRGILKLTVVCVRTYLERVACGLDNFQYFLNHVILQLPQVHRYFTGGTQSLVPQPSCDHSSSETDGGTSAEQISGTT